MSRYAFMQWAKCDSCEHGNTPIFLKNILITNPTFIQCNNNLIIVTKFGNIILQS